MRGPLLRILHTHMEDFTPGGGRKQKKIKAPSTPGNRTLDDEGICIFPPARNIKKMEGCAHKDDIPAPACVLHYGPRPHSVLTRHAWPPGTCSSASRRDDKCEKDISIITF